MPSGSSAEDSIDAMGDGAAEQGWSPSDVALRESENGTPHVSKHHSLEESAAASVFGSVESAAYDSLFLPGFNVVVFLRQVLIHLFWPLSLFWYPRRRYPRGIRNQGLGVDPRVLWRTYGARSIPLTFVALSPIICWGILALEVASPRRFRAARVDRGELFYVPMVILVARMCSIGVKYATLTTKEHERFMNVPLAVATDYADQIQLISGFIHLSDLVIQTELRTAISRVGLDPKEMAFTSHEHDAENERVWRDLLAIGLEDRDSRRPPPTAAEKAGVEVDALGSWPLRRPRRPPFDGQCFDA